MISMKNFTELWSSLEEDKKLNKNKNVISFTRGLSALYNDNISLGNYSGIPLKDVLSLYQAFLVSVTLPSGEKEEVALEVENLIQSKTTLTLSTMLETTSHEGDTSLVPTTPVSPMTPSSDIPTSVPVLYPFKPNQSEFSEAKDYLQDLPDGSKFAKKGTSRKYSFIKSGGKVIAMSNKACFKTKGGSFGLFKRGLTEDGIEVGIKIEPRKLRRLDDPTYIAATRIGLTLSQAQRSEPGMKFQTIGETKSGLPKRHVFDKLYTILKLGGNDLFKLLSKEYKHGVQLNDLQRELLFLHILHQVYVANCAGVIHGDLKPENILATINGNQMRVDLTDVDLAHILPEGETQLIAEKISGSPVYMAPEIFTERLYSSASDLYALGTLFLLDLNIEPYDENLDNKVSFKIRSHYFNHVRKRTEQHQMPKALLAFYKDGAFQHIPHFDIIQKMLEVDVAKRASTSEIILLFCEDLLQKAEVTQDLDLMTQILAIKNFAFEKQDLSVTSRLQGA